jgi:hypothetical protein
MTPPGGAWALAVLLSQPAGEGQTGATRQEHGPMSVQSKDATSVHEGHAVRLETTTGEDGQVRLSVIGLASARTAISYVLDVTGGSRLRQSGHALLEPGRQATLCTITIDGDRPWTAEIEVRQDGQGSYRITQAG